MDNSDFPTWLEREMQNRGWNQAELSRRSGLTPPTISKVISRERMPGSEFCVAIAKAFGVREIVVLQKAGIVGDEGPQKYSPIVESAAAMLNELSEEDQEDIRAMVRSKWERKQRKQVAKRHE